MPCASEAETLAGIDPIDARSTFRCLSAAQTQAATTAAQSRGEEVRNERNQNEEPRISIKEIRGSMHKRGSD
jgi:hypothetical protein